MKVICLNQSPLNPRSRRLSYADAFIREGIDFEFWDLTDFFGMFPSQVNDQENEPYVRKYTTLVEIDSALRRQNFKDTLFFIGVPDSWKHRLFFKCLANHKCMVIRSNPCANTVCVKRTLFEKVKLATNYRKVISFFQRKLFNYYCDFYNFKYTDVFSSSIVDARTMPINHPDYEEFIKCKQRGTDLEKELGRYAVFYDCYFPLHPDLKGNINASQENYLTSLNRFFEEIEKQYQVQIIIALHPSSNYKGDEFNGRKMIMWQTCNLTIHSQFVINHISNCTSFAMLANKPIVFISNNEFEKHEFLAKYMRTLSNLLGLKCYNIDKTDISTIDIKDVAKTVREKYIYTYLTDKTIEDKTNEQIYVDYVRSKDYQPS